MYEASGTIKLIQQAQSFASGFTKREFVITTLADKYPQDLKFELVKDKCGLIDAFAVGQNVQVSFDIRGNEFNGKYYVNLSAWKIQPLEGQAPAPQGEPDMAEMRREDDFDDVPF